MLCFVRLLCCATNKKRERYRKKKRERERKPVALVLSLLDYIAPRMSSLLLRLSLFLSFGFAPGYIHIYISLLYIICPFRLLYIKYTWGMSIDISFIIHLENISLFMPLFYAFSASLSLSLSLSLISSLFYLFWFIYLS